MDKINFLYKELLLNKKYKPYKIKKVNKIILENEFDSILTKIFNSLNIKNIEISLSLNKIFDQKDHCSQNILFEEYLNKKSDLYIYIAQFPLFYKLENEYINDNRKLFFENKIKFKLFFEKFKIPKFIKNKKFNIKYINLWASKKKTISNWHFDSYDNYLWLIKGNKKIFLKKKINSKEIIVNLEINQIIRIPEYYFHKVESEPNTIAINFWFNTHNNIIINNHPSPLLNLISNKIINEKLDEIFLDKIVTYSQLNLYPSTNYDIIKLIYNLNNLNEKINDQYFTNKEKDDFLKENVDYLKSEQFEKYKKIYKEFKLDLLKEQLK